MKKLNNLAKEINELLLENSTIKEYLMLKKEIEEDNVLQELKKQGYVFSEKSEKSNSTLRISTVLYIFSFSFNVT